jgi:hypothetical protein
MRRAMHLHEHRLRALTAVRTAPDNPRMSNALALCTVLAAMRGVPARAALKKLSLT